MSGFKLSNMKGQKKSIQYKHHIVQFELVVGQTFHQVVEYKRLKSNMEYLKLLLPNRAWKWFDCNNLGF